MINDNIKRIRQQALYLYNRLDEIPVDVLTPMMIADILEDFNQLTQNQLIGITNVYLRDYQKLIEEWIKAED